MNVDEVGTYLEHQGFSDAEIDDVFLEHFGVRGMKWGQRKALQINAERAAKGKPGVKNSQYVGNKLTRGVGYYVAYAVGVNTTFKIMQKKGKDPVKSLAAASAGGIAGIVATNMVLKRVGKKRRSELESVISEEV